MIKRWATRGATRAAVATGAAGAAALVMTTLAMIVAPGARVDASPPAASPNGIATRLEQASAPVRQLLRQIESGPAAPDEARFEIDPVAVRELLRAPLGAPVRVNLAMGTELAGGGDGLLALELRRFEVIAPDARFLRGRPGQAALPLPPPRVLLLRGDIAGEHGSHAFLALDERGLASGNIARASGTTLIIASDRAQPDGGAERRTLVVRRGEQALPAFDDFCATVVPAGGGGIAGTPVPADPARGPRLLRVAIDSDQRFAQLFSDEAEAQSYIVQLVAAVSDIYQRDLDLRLAIAFTRLWPEGGEPFAANSLSGFRNYWQNNEDMEGLNLVHMLSGRRDLGYGGVAYLVNGCSSSAFGISGFLLGQLPKPVGPPHLDNWDVVVAAHEMGHNLGTGHTHDYSPPIDTCASGQDRRSEIMSYCHIRPGGLYNIDLRFSARVQENIALDNPGDSCLVYDCNGNGVDDAADIAALASADVNTDSIPDECQDCNGNGILDPIDIVASRSLDVNGNGIPDECEADCNGNATPDEFETAGNPALDVNANLIPDSCEPDCDGNGVADFKDILDGTHTDLDRDCIPDVCNDCNNNGTADWLDVDREFNVFLGMVTGEFIVGPVREYHARSGVFVTNHADKSTGQAHDLVFGADRRLYVTNFVADWIALADVDTPSATLFVGPGEGGLLGPSSLSFGPDGNLYVASQGTDSILRYHGATGAFIDEFVPSGSGGLEQPWDIAFGPNGNLFVLTNAAGVLEYDGASGAFASVFAALDNLTMPRGMCFLPNGELLVTDHAGTTIERISASGADLGRWNDNYALLQPWGVTVGPNGNIYAAARTDPVRVIEYDRATGRYLRSFIRGDDDLVSPTAIAFRPQSPNDINGNSRPDECDAALCPADLTRDLNVSVGDLFALIGAWGSCPECDADLNGDGYVGVSDLLLLIVAWGPCGG